MGQHYIYTGKESGVTHIVSFEKFRSTAGGNPVTKLKAYVDGFYKGTSDTIYGDQKESALSSWLAEQKEDFEIGESFKNYTTALNEASIQRDSHKPNQELEKDVFQKFEEMNPENETEQDYDYDLNR